MPEDKPRNGLRPERIWPWVLILVNLGGLAWGAAKLDARIDANAMWIKENKAAVMQVPILCERLNHICETLDEIKAELRTINRTHGPRPGS